MRKLIVRLTVLAALLVPLAACDPPPPPPPRTWSCPKTLPGGPLTDNKPIPVILTIDDTGQPATPAQIADNNGPALACEPDANGNGQGDETEVELVENAQNAQQYDD